MRSSNANAECLTTFDISRCSVVILVAHEGVHSLFRPSVGPVPAAGSLRVVVVAFFAELRLENLHSLRGKGIMQKGSRRGAMAIVDWPSGARAGRDDNRWATMRCWDDGNRRISQKSISLIPDGDRLLKSAAMTIAATAGHCNHRITMEIVACCPPRTTPICNVSIIST